MTFLRRSGLALMIEKIGQILVKNASRLILGDARCAVNQTIEWSQQKSEANVRRK